VRDFWVQKDLEEFRYVMDWTKFEIEFCGYKFNLI